MPLWDHQVDELMNSNIGIKTTNAQFIHDKWMNLPFVPFVFKYARLVSNTRKMILDKVKDNLSNLFGILNCSNIVLAILIYINNEEY